MNERIEKYRAAIELLKYEGDITWKILSSYMVVNSIIIGLIINNDYQEYLPKKFYICRKKP